MSVPTAGGQEEPGLQERYLRYQVEEGQRRTESGHQRMNFLGTMTLGVLALYGGALVSFPIPWWGPACSMALGFTAFIVLLRVARPHQHTSVKQFFWLPRSRPDYGVAAKLAKNVTEQVLLREIAEDVDFYNWGIPRREIQYVRSGWLLGISVLPLAYALVQHFIQ